MTTHCLAATHEGPVRIKDKYFGLNLLWLAGNGIGVETGTALGSKYRNLSVVSRLSYWSAPGDTESNPVVLRGSFGVCYFPALLQYQGIFFHDMLTLTYASYAYPDSTSTGSLFAVGPVSEVGYRRLFGSTLCFQASLGVGFMYQGLLSVPAGERAELVRDYYRRNWNLNMDGSVEVGGLF
jgi:hypothetical protein